MISQSPKGKSVDEGSTIPFAVSKGKEGDSSDVKTTAKSADAPYTGKNDKSQKVKVYTKDKGSDGSTEKGSFDITSDQRIDTPLRIEEGKAASHIVKVDGKTVTEKEISYDDV